MTDVPAAAAAGLVLAHVDGPLPAPSALTWLVDWHPDPLPLVAVAAALLVYLAGVRRLVERGDAWPVGRTLAWAAGLLVVLYAVAGPVETYDRTLFSAHMVQHMLLAMVAPVPLALGAPVTLALRALPGGRGGAGTPRALLLRLLHSRLVAVLGSPLVAFAVFVANPFALYFTPLYGATLSNDLLHQVLHLHFLAVGCLFFWTLVGVDPTPGRPSYPLRLLLVFAVLPFHAFLGIAVMTATGSLAPGHYEAVAASLPWYTDPAADQQLGGGLLWASGDLVGLGFLVVLFLQWSRDEDRLASRTDRRLDRGGAPRATAAARPRGAAAGRARGVAAGPDATLDSYNSYLAGLAARDASPADVRDGSRRAGRVRAASRSSVPVPAVEPGGAGREGSGRGGSERGTPDEAPAPRG